jgi:hypothetical protein
MVARYESRPVRDDDCTDDQAGPRDLVAMHRPSSPQGNLPGRITLDDEWYMGPGGKELVAFGRKPADHDQSASRGFMR